MASVFKLRLATAALLLAACNPKELPQPAGSPSRIVLIGELVAGDSVQIRAGHSQSFATAVQSVAELEHDMQISCTSSAGARALTAYEDDLLYSVFTTKFSNRQPVLEGTAYSVKATKPGFEAVQATVSVPRAFQGNTTQVHPVLRNGDSMYAFRVDMGGFAPGSRYVIEVLRSPVSINATFFYDNEFRDLERERRLYDSLIRMGERIDVWRDTSYSGLTDRQLFYTDRTSAENTAPGTQRPYYWFFIKPDAEPSLSMHVFVPTAARKLFPNNNLQLIIRLKSVAPDYYEFLRAYELGNLQPEDNNQLFIKPSSAAGNVKSGLGVVGGVYLRESRFLY